MNIFIGHLFAVLSVFILRVLVPPHFYIPTIAVFGLSHYLVAAFYSKEQFKKVCSTHRGIIIFLIFFGVGVFLMLKNWPLMIGVFGIHHVLSEVYSETSAREENKKNLILFRYVFHSALYAFILRNPMGMAWVPLYGWGLLFSASLFFLVKTQKAEIWPKELVLLIFVPLSFFIKIYFYDFLFYHFAFWLVYPLFQQQIKLFSVEMKWYLGLTLFTLICLIGYWLWGGPSIAESTRAGKMILQLNGFAYVHVLISFALSRSNPMWIRRIFRTANPLRI